MLQGESTTDKWYTPNKLLSGECYSREEKKENAVLSQRAAKISIRPNAGNGGKFNVKGQRCVNVIVS